MSKNSLLSKDTSKYSSHLRPLLARITLTQANLLLRIKQAGREAGEHAAASVLILTFTLILFTPLFSNRTFSIVGAHMFSLYPWTGLVHQTPEIVGAGYPQTDHAETFYPNSVFATNAVRSGQLPMWFPYSFGGVPLLELGLTGWLYPPRLVAMALWDPIRQHDVLLFVHLLVAGLGMYGLLRGWGANAIGGILGAIVWEFNGHNMFWLTLEHVAIAAAWLPLMLLAAALAIRRQSYKWAVASGAGLGMAMLSGSLTYVYLGMLILVGWYGVLTALAARRVWLEGNRKSALTYLLLPVCSAIVAIALSAACWLPLTQWLPNVHREVLTAENQLAYAISPKDLASALLSPESNSGPAGKGPDFPSFAFTGILAVIFAVVALVRLSAPVVLGALVCLSSLGFALGVGPWVRLLRALPYFGTMSPHTGFYLFTFSIAVLAAFGLTVAGRGLSRFRPPNLILVALGGLLVVIEAWQLIAFAWAINPVQAERPEWLFPETPVISALRSLQTQYRILPVRLRLPSDQWTPPVLGGKVAACFDLRSGSGYESLLPLPTAALWRTVEQNGILASNVPPAFRPSFNHDSLPFDLLEKLSVGLVVAPPGTFPRDVTGSDPMKNGKLQLVYEGLDGLIYKLDHALPRAFLASQVLAAPDAPTSLKMLVDPKFDARKVAIVIGEQTALQTGLAGLGSQTESLNGTATIVTDRLNEVEIEVATPKRAMMVLNDSWASGWKVYVDGVRQPVIRVNYNSRGVVVQEGKHEVAFLYRPTFLFVGLAISGGTLLLLLIFYTTIAWRAQRRFRHPVPQSAP